LIHICVKLNATFTPQSMKVWCVSLLNRVREVLFTLLSM